MKEFIEQTLHQKIELTPYKETNKFPLILQANYDFYQLKILKQICILARPKEDYRLVLLRSHQKRIEHLTGIYCVLYLEKLNYYSRDKMLEEGIPFIWEKHQVYIPFLGLMLRSNELREIKPCFKISFLTQKFLLLTIYENWDNLTVTTAAEKMNVSKMSVTRAFDEIESLNIPVLKKSGKRRVYTKAGNRKEMWNIIRPFLRTPLLKEYYLIRKLPDTFLKSGISGLAELSLLTDNSYPTYAVVKNEIRSKGIYQEKQIPVGETPGCVIQELGYCIPFKHKNIIDPLSIYLLLENSDDPRVEVSLEEMLEEYVW